MINQTITKYISIYDTTNYDILTNKYTIYVYTPVRFNKIDVQLKICTQTLIQTETHTHRQRHKYTHILYILLMYLVVLTKRLANPK